MVVINHKKGRAFAPTLGFGGLMTHTCGTNSFIEHREQVLTGKQKLSHGDNYQKRNEG